MYVPACDKFYKLMILLYFKITKQQECKYVVTDLNTN